MVVLNIKKIGSVLISLLKIGHFGQGSVSADPKIAASVKPYIFHDNIIKGTASYFFLVELSIFVIFSLKCTLASMFSIEEGTFSSPSALVYREKSNRLKQFFSQKIRK